MIIAGHQADLLPDTGFWHQMAKADLFDLSIYDLFQPRGFQRRVMMRGQWASIPVIGNTTRTPISDVRILPEQSPQVLSALIAERYEGARYWNKFGPHILDMVHEIRTEHLWQFNLHLILGIRELLDIRTPISIARRPKARGSASVARRMKQYNATTYLAGTAGKAYMDLEEFDDAGIEVKWSNHRAVTGDSILSVLMDYDDPMAVVMAEHRVRVATPA